MSRGDKKSQNLSWTTFGRYALLDKIGSGGMAEIYRAKTFGAAGFEKEFAIKLILPSLVDDTEFVEMFINEAKIAVSLYHANIVQVFDLGELEGQYYIAMEFVNGMDLLDVLARCAQLDLKIPLDIVLFITMEALKGLDFAHRARNAYGEELNIIHRDVSPSNVLISYAGDVKIGDFGVAKAAIQRNLTETGTLKGKVGYMSPEQVIGEEIDARSDIFSAGIVFFEALSMSRLFVGSSDLDVMLRVRDADIGTSLKKVGPMPDQLEQIVRKALSRHREERFQSAGEFYQALVDFCYQHRIKVTGTDLSNFMRRLFADEIEKDKNRRLEDQKNTSNQRIAEELRQREAAVQVPEPLGQSEDSDDDFDRAEPVAEEEESEPIDISSPAEVMVSRDPSYIEDSEPEEIPAGIDNSFRYRDQSGLIYGPMGHKTLVGLLKDRRGGARDRISVDGGDWVPPDKVQGLDEFVDVAPAEVSDATDADEVAPQSAPAASAPAELGAEDTYREPAPAPNSAPDRKKNVAALLEAASQLEEMSSVDSPLAHAPTAADDDSDGADDAPRGVATAERKSRILKMRERYASYEGSLAQVSFARLLARLHRGNSTGRLFVKNGDIEKSIFFEAGEPILVDSNKPEELLGAFLLSREIITQAQLEEGLTRLSEWGGRLGDALVAIGAIPAHEIFTHLADQMREKLLDVFTWETGEYGYFENQAPETHGYPLGVETYETMVEGCLDRKTFTRIEQFYENRLPMAMNRREPPPVSIDELKLSSKALRVIKAYQPGFSLQSLINALPELDDTFIYRVVYLLHQVEFLSFEVTESQELPGPEPD
jgi:serine/threonine protein kinase